MAQQQEKRIALVIGNGAYAKRPLATAANDGGLIAQTLQAAGFDVSGPATSTATLCAIRFGISSRRRKSLARHRRRRLSLRVCDELAGENYFIPVDTTITRDTDIPIEGLRLSDYMRSFRRCRSKSVSS